MVQVPRCKVTSIEDNHGLELENRDDHPPRNAGNVQPELVCNVTPPNPQSDPHCVAPLPFS